MSLTIWMLVSTYYIHSIDILLTQGSYEMTHCWLYLVYLMVFEPKKQHRRVQQFRIKVNVYFFLFSLVLKFMLFDNCIVPFVLCVQASVPIEVNTNFKFVFTIDFPQPPTTYNILILYHGNT